MSATHEFFSHLHFSDNIWEGKWEEYSPDCYNVSKIVFDRSGRLFVLAFTNGKLEIWDASGTPVAMTYIPYGDEVDNQQAKNTLSNTNTSNAGTSAILNMGNPVVEKKGRFGLNNVRSSSKDKDKTDAKESDLKLGDVSFPNIAWSEDGTNIMVTLHEGLTSSYQYGGERTIKKWSRAVFVWNIWQKQCHGPWFLPINVECIEQVSDSDCCLLSFTNKQGHAVLNARLGWLHFVDIEESTISFGDQYKLQKYPPRNDNLDIINDNILTEEICESKFSSSVVSTTAPPIHPSSRLLLWKEGITASKPQALVVLNYANGDAYCMRFVDTNASSDRNLSDDATSNSVLQLEARAAENVYLASGITYMPPGLGQVHYLEVSRSHPERGRLLMLGWSKDRVEVRSLADPAQRVSVFQYEELYGYQPLAFSGLGFFYDRAESFPNVNFDGREVLFGKDMLDGATDIPGLVGMADADKPYIAMVSQDCGSKAAPSLLGPTIAHPMGDTLYFWDVLENALPASTSTPTNTTEDANLLPSMDSSSSISAQSDLVTIVPFSLNSLPSSGGIVAFNPTGVEQKLHIYWAIPNPYYRKVEVWGVNTEGKLMLYRPRIVSDFPGCMWPIGYTLKSDNFEYVEREDEMDVTVLNRKDGFPSKAEIKKMLCVPVMPPIPFIDVGSTFKPPLIDKSGYTARSVPLNVDVYDECMRRDRVRAEDAQKRKEERNKLGLGLSQQGGDSIIPKGLEEGYTPGVAAHLADHSYGSKGVELDREALRAMIPTSSNEEVLLATVTTTRRGSSRSRGLTRPVAVNAKIMAYKDQFGDVGEDARASNPIPPGLVGSKFGRTPEENEVWGDDLDFDEMMFIPDRIKSGEWQAEVKQQMQVADEITAMLNDEEYIEQKWQEQLAEMEKNQNEELRAKALKFINSKVKKTIKAELQQAVDEGTRKLCMDLLDQHPDPGSLKNLDELVEGIQLEEVVSKEPFKTESGEEFEMLSVEYKILQAPKWLAEIQQRQQILYRNATIAGASGDGSVPLDIDQALDGREDAENKIKLQLKRCSQLLDELFSHKDGVYFREPVDVVALKIPDYPNICPCPMDFGTIRSKLKANQYAHALEFEADVRLVIRNALTYNPFEKHVVHIAAKTLGDLFNRKISIIMNALDTIIRMPAPPVVVPEPVVTLMDVAGGDGPDMPGGEEWSATDSSIYKKASSNPIQDTTVVQDTDAAIIVPQAEAVVVQTGWTTAQPTVEQQTSAMSLKEQESSVVPTVMKGDGPPVEDTVDMKE